MSHTATREPMVETEDGARILAERSVLLRAYLDGGGTEEAFAAGWPALKAEIIEQRAFRARISERK